MDFWNIVILKGFENLDLYENWKCLAHGVSFHSVLLHPKSVKTSWSINSFNWLLGYKKRIWKWLVSISLDMWEEEKLLLEELSHPRCLFSLLCSILAASCCNLTIFVQKNMWNFSTCGDPNNCLEPLLIFWAELKISKAKKQEWKYEQNWKDGQTWMKLNKIYKIGKIWWMWTATKKDKILTNQ